MAVAVASKKKLQLVRDTSKQKKVNPFFAFIHKLIAFPLWKMVATCLVPFLLVGGLLLGASYMRKNSANDTVEIPKAVTAPVAADAWKKMTELAQVEDAIKSHIQQARQLNQMLQMEYAQLTQLQSSPAGSSLMQRQKDDLNKKMEMQRNQLNAERNAFYQTCQLYQKLGGQVDYNGQFPN